MSNPRILTSAADVTDDVLAVVDDCLDWFEGQPLRTDEFIDRLCDTYGGSEWDIESYASPAAAKIMRHARGLRRERS